MDILQKYESGIFHTCRIYRQGFDFLKKKNVKHKQQQIVNVKYVSHNSVTPFPSGVGILQSSCVTINLLSVLIHLTKYQTSTMKLCYRVFLLFKFWNQV